MSMLLDCAGGFPLLCEKGPMCAVRMSGAVLLCGEGLVLSADSERRIEEMKIDAGDCASLAREFGTCLVQDCKDATCFGDVGAAARDDCVAVPHNALSVTKRKAEKTLVKDALAEGGDFNLEELRFGFARNVWRGFGSIEPVRAERHGLEDDWKVTKRG